MIRLDCYHSIGWLQCIYSVMSKPELICDAFVAGLLKPHFILRSNSSSTVTFWDEKKRTLSLGYATRKPFREYVYIECVNEFNLRKNVAQLCVGQTTKEKEKEIFLLWLS